MTAISSTLLDSSSRTGVPSGAAAVDFKSLSAANVPLNRSRTTGGAVLVASTFAPPAPSLLETAVANLRWTAQFMRPLAGQALRAMVATAGSVASLGGQLAALGRPIAQAVVNIAVAIGEVELAAALALAAGWVLVTATPTSSNDMVPPSPRNTPTRPRVDGGNPQPGAAVPPKQTQTQPQTQAPKQTQAVKPSAPSAVQVQQNQASMAAVESLTRANTATPQMYAAVEKFYDVASGGRAARANGSLAAPMQAVRQSRSALNDAIVQSEKQIAGSAAQDRSALKGWHDTLVTARTSIDKWIASADAFSAGLDRPGGSRTAQPPLPSPPSSVVNAPGSARTSDQVAQRLVTTYEGANNAMHRGTADATSSTRRTAPTVAPDPAAAQSQAARALLAQTDPITARMNKGVEAFYQQAAGGKAARQNGALTEALRTVTESKAELNRLILASNKSIAASSPADYPGLDRWRTSLRAARDAVDAWLPKANAFAAGLSGPGGKPAAHPALPAIPGVVAGKGGASSTADSAPMVRAHDGAQAALAKPSAVRATAPSDGNALPKVNVVSTMPANVKYQADVWLNRDTGAVSATAQSGPGWVKSVLGMSGMTPPPARPNGGGGEPQQGAKTEATGTPVNIEKAEFFLAPPPNGGGDKDPKDKYNLHIWTGTIAAMTGAVFSGGFFWHSKVGTDEAAIAKREADFHPKADFTIFELPKKTGTPAEKLEAIASAWEHYLGQVPINLQKSALDDTTIASLADKDQPGDHKFADQFTADAQAFVKDLRQRGKALLFNAKTPEEQARVLDGLAQRPFMPRSFDLDSAGSRELYKDKAGRPSKALNELTPLVQAAVRGEFASILASPAAAPTGKAAPAAGNPTTAAPTGTTQKPAAKSPEQEMNEIRGKIFAPPKLGVPTAPPVSDKTPPPVATAKPVLSTVPPVTTRPPPTAPTATTTTPVVPSKPVKPAAPSQAELKKRDELAVLPGLGTAVASAQLSGAPPTTTLAELRFTRSMFIEPGKEGDTPSIQLALRKAQTIQGAAQAAQQRATGYDTKMAIVNGPLASIQAVIADLNRLQTAVNQRAVAPAIPVTPNSPAPLDESPSPGDVPTPTQPLKGDTAP